jgi:medium-chain acyl-[acyl-carrier-protein] hydrolase
MKNLSERIVSLPPDKQALLLQRLKSRADSVGGEPPRTAAHPEKWLVRYRTNEQARLRLFCLPYAGGGASIFRPWLDALPADVELCGVQLPGRENRLGEAAYTRLVPLVQALADALLPYLDRPFAFYGHSMGTLLSFELARQLRRMGKRLPVSLYLAAYRAPHLPNPNIKIYHLPTEVFKVVLRADGIPETILQNEELMQAILPTLRADFELCDTYVYQEEPPLDCPFAIFGGSDDVRVQAADLELWSQHSSLLCSQTILPGSHFFLHSSQNLLLDALSRELQVHLHTANSHV